MSTRFYKFIAYQANYVCFLRFGPLINHWTARFEVKHKDFKHLANVMGNYTNICYSLSLRHQLHNYYTTLNDKALFAENIEVGPGIYKSVI